MLLNLVGNETQRLQAIAALTGTDESRDEVLDKFVRLASQALGIAGSFIAVLDDHHQFVKASHNFSLRQTTRTDSFCRYVVDSQQAVVVADTLQDGRFCSHPLVVGTPYIRFYAGVPLQSCEGVILGTLCATDSIPHVFSAKKLNTLHSLATLVMSFLETWHAAGFTDAVTRLPNRQRLIRDLQLLARNSPGQACSLVIIDCIALPRAHELARSLGMAPVEALLKDMAALLRLRLKMRGNEVLYTVATGRYAILSANDSRFSAQTVSEKLRAVSAEIEDGISVQLNVHAGEVCFDASSLNARQVIRRAISALQQAISQKIRAKRFTDTTDDKHNDDLQLMDDLASALSHDQGGLYLVYQPKVTVTSGQPIGLKAELRWRHPLRGELSAAEFLPIAQHSQVMDGVTDWVTDETIRQLKRWQGSAYTLPISMMVSVSDLCRSKFADDLNNKMAKARLPVSLLAIECIDIEKAPESPLALPGLERLKRLGFSIAIDDFGAGYNHHRYLRRLPNDVIKLDRGLVSELSRDTGSRVIASSIIRMLKDLDYGVVAEGAEDDTTRSMLQEFGCDQVQGYYFAKPQSAAELERWLAAKTVLPATAGHFYPLHGAGGTYLPG